MVFLVGFKLGKVTFDVSGSVARRSHMTLASVFHCRTKVNK
jgi:hypothetical protein